MSIQSLLQRRAQTERKLSQARAAKLEAENKLNRLQQAKAEIGELKAEMNQINQKVKTFEIPTSEWKGTTESDYQSGPKAKVETAVTNYVNHLEDNSSRIDEEISRLINQIETYTSQISSYNSTISLINYEIRNYKE
ncbi:DUF5082 family protein [Pseudogracilibacillus auburnensis]|uniref:Uncharacterized protein DUF5082 n=1 Tax=Pseudogracilibacillus auburnensis TaxID=1494959 RepID=A0A2V3VZH9_9BACI|nr:DUF5082 family protein [Pseudogracilibacillus auburnensis]MBO1002412.1 DUF5082 family protein [Pseudogracilibacillus auburnensis]PXW86198.1 uncharacterized protein DUF5082 [Pseudogracilibacillus auburnensis]